MNALRTFWVTGIRGRCPSCQQTSMFAGFYTLHERCAVCDTRFEPRAGEWLGATAFGYTIGAVIGILLAFVEVLWAPFRALGLPPMWTIAAIALAATAVGYHWAKALWCALLYEWGFTTRGDAPPGPPPEP